MNLIVNVTENWGIGFENQLLVSISADLKRFRSLTMGKAVVLGRKTLETFPGGRPLKGRRNLIMSTNKDYAPEGAEVYHSLPELLDELRKLDTDEVCVIGGASIYEALLPYCSTAQITKTYVDCKADRFFPNLDAMANWKIEKIYDLEEENGIRFQYVDYVNNSPLAL